MYPRPRAVQCANALHAPCAAPPPVREVGARVHPRNTLNILRKRELLLSLKYCTIEACFSVPMLTLTLGNMPFLIGFAVKALGWSDRAIGLLAATPFLCLFLQPPITIFLQRHWSLHRIMAVTFVINALPWLVTLSFPWMGESKHALFATIVFVSNLGNAVCGVAWSA